MLVYKRILFKCDREFAIIIPNDAVRSINGVEFINEGSPQYELTSH